MKIVENFKELNKICQKPHYKEKGNWMVRNIIREACVPVTYFLLKTPVTANQVTVFSLLLGIAGCAAFLISPKLSFLWLAILLHLSYYFDHVDGQIARCKKQVSLSGMMLDFITHYIIYGAVAVSLGLKAYYESGSMFYVYCGIVAAISLISFNLLADSKYRTFFVEMLKHEHVKIKRSATEAKKERRNIFARAFSVLHKTCEIHVIINTVTVVAILQLFGLNGLSASNGIVTWAEITAFYYAAASLGVALIKTFFLVATRKPDKEFKNLFSTGG
ncbi:MAG: CDP-alcohol phosphatidyltransferase family protein [Candidatus Omnitrophota bacterium]|jgi:phosphatidylglycerophosphate synthase